LIAVVIAASCIAGLRPMFVPRPVLAAAGTLERALVDCVRPTAFTAPVAGRLPCASFSAIGCFLAAFFFAAFASALAAGTSATAAQARMAVGARKPRRICWKGMARSFR
jgi:hypothetical protein